MDGHRSYVGNFRSRLAGIPSSWSYRRNFLALSIIFWNSLHATIRFDGHGGKKIKSRPS